MFKGSMVAIVTPFKDGRIDRKRYKELVEFQISQGTSAIVPCGTTGESATLSHNEHDEMVKITTEYVAGRVPVIAGTGSNSTQEAISLTRHAQDSGADASLLITPYYNKPTQQGLYEHFKAVAEAVDFPIILYNVPGRTAVNLLPETIARLSQIGNIKAVKEAVNRAREGGGPTLVVAKNWRYVGHFVADDQSYRDPKISEPWMKLDPIHRMTRFLLESGVASEKEIETIRAAAEKSVEDAIEFGKISPEPTPDQLFQDLYAPD